MAWSGVKEAEAFKLAGTQHGLITRAQLEQLGVSRRTISRRIKAKLWTRLYPGVFRLIRETKSRWMQELKAVLLWLGEDVSAVSHRAAAKLLGMDGVEVEEIEVSTMRTRGGVAPRGVVIHRVSELSRQTIIVDGLRVTQKERTLRDLASVVTKDALDSSVESVLRTQKSTVKWLERVLHRMGNHFRGRGILRRLIEERSVEAPTDSEAERLFLRNVVEPYGLPKPVHNRRLYDANGNFVAKPDFLFEEHGIVVEIYSKKFHGKEGHAVHDTARQNRITALGYSVLIFWWQDVMGDGAASAEAIRDMIARRSQ